MVRVVAIIAAEIRVLRVYLAGLNFKTKNIYIYGVHKRLHLFRKKITLWVWLIQHDTSGKCTLPTNVHV